MRRQFRGSTEPPGITDDQIIPAYTRFDTGLTWKPWEQLPLARRDKTCCRIITRSSKIFSQHAVRGNQAQRICPDFLAILSERRGTLDFASMASAGHAWAGKSGSSGGIADCGSAALHRCCWLFLFSAVVPARAQQKRRRPLQREPRRSDEHGSHFGFEEGAKIVAGGRGDFRDYPRRHPALGRDQYS